MAECKDCIQYDVCQYHITEETSFTTNECGKFLNNADVVEVVRCKDCIYKHTAESTPITYCKALSSGIIRPVLIEDNDYCSYGKRKEVEE